MTNDEGTGMMTVAGEQLQVRTFRPPGAASDGPTLVLLHEALGSIAQWRDFPAALVEATGLPALLYDRCGFGGSQPLAAPRGRDYLAKEVDRLETLLQICKVSQPLLVGHSDGATLALQYAATFPGRPLAVISEAAHLFVEEETLAGIRAAVQRWQTTDLRQRLARYHGDKADAVFAAWTDTWLDPEFHAWNIEALMPRVTCPVLAIQGEDDEFGTARQLEAICAGVSGPCRSRLIATCGHIPHHQARSAVLAEMSAFIGDLPRPA